MTQLPHREEMPNQAAANSPAAALVIWLTGQLVLLAAIWADLRLSANPNHTAAQIGPHLLLAGQLILSAALLADLARTIQVATIAFAITFPITQLAGWKCGVSPSASLLDSAILLLWLAGLTCWMRIARSARARHLLAAAMMLWIVATPLLWYLLAEFTPGTMAQRLIPAISPLMLVAHAPQLLLVVTIHTAIAAIAAAIRYRRPQ